VKSGQAFINKEEFLFLAARKNDFNMILNNNYVISREDCLKLDYYGRSALCYALHHDNIQFTKFLLAHGADVNRVCDS
jgi:ankyrin repeat protein